MLQFYCYVPFIFVVDLSVAGTASVCVTQFLIGLMCLFVFKSFFGVSKVVGFGCLPT
jgi:hypothetical protein